MQQTTFDYFFRDSGEIELWLRLGAINLREYWLLSGNYTFLPLQHAQRGILKSVSREAANE